LLLARKKTSPDQGLLQTISRKTNTLNTYCTDNKMQDKTLKTGREQRGQNALLQHSGTIDLVVASKMT
jgi:hypothetical protein